jgi:hypothetical protein
MAGDAAAEMSLRCGGLGTTQGEEIAKGLVPSWEELELERLPNADVIVTNWTSAHDDEFSGEHESRVGGGGFEGVAAAQPGPAVAMTRRRCSLMSAYEAFAGLRGAWPLALEGRGGEGLAVEPAASKKGDGKSEKPSKDRFALSPSFAVRSAALDAP